MAIAFASAPPLLDRSNDLQPCITALQIAANAAGRVTAGMCPQSRSTTCTPGSRDNISSCSCRGIGRSRQVANVGHRCLADQAPVDRLVVQVERVGDDARRIRDVRERLVVELLAVRGTQPLRVVRHRRGHHPTVAAGPRPRRSPPPPDASVACSRARCLPREAPTRRSTRCGASARRAPRRCPVRRARPTSARPPPPRPRVGPQPRPRAPRRHTRRRSAPSCRPAFARPTRQVDGQSRSVEIRDQSIPEPARARATVHEEKRGRHCGPSWSRCMKYMIWAPSEAPAPEETGVRNRPTDARWVRASIQWRSSGVVHSPPHLRRSTATRRACSAGRRRQTARHQPYPRARSAHRAGA